MPKLDVRWHTKAGGDMTYACTMCEQLFDPKGFVARSCAACEMPIYFPSLGAANSYTRDTGVYMRTAESSPAK